MERDTVYTAYNSSASRAFQIVLHVFTVFDYTGHCYTNWDNK